MRVIAILVNVHSVHDRRESVRRIAIQSQDPDRCRRMSFGIRRSEVHCLSFDGHLRCPMPYGEPVPSGKYVTGGYTIVAIVKIAALNGDGSKCTIVLLCTVFVCDCVPQSYSIECGTDLRLDRSIAGLHFSCRHALLGDFLLLVRWKIPISMQRSESSLKLYRLCFSKSATHL